MKETGGVCTDRIRTEEISGILPISITTNVFITLSIYGYLF